MYKLYPSQIAPKHGFRFRLPMLKLLKDYSDLVVVRRCKSKDLFIISSKGGYKQLKEEILENNLLEMSVNLLGGPFQKCHVPFIPKGDLVRNEWDGKDICNFPLSDENYSLNEECGMICFSVNKINKCTFPYLKTVTKADYKGLKEKSEEIKKRESLNIIGDIIGVLGAGNNKKTQVFAYLHVNHHPNILNYWHMQIDSYEAGARKYVRYEDKSGEARQVRHELRSYISHLRFAKLNCHYYIGRKYYSHNVNPLFSIYDRMINWFYCRFHSFIDLFSKVFFKDSHLI